MSKCAKNKIYEVSDALYKLEDSVQKLRLCGVNTSYVEPIIEELHMELDNMIFMLEVEKKNVTSNI